MTRRPGPLRRAARRLSRAALPLALGLVVPASAGAESRGIERARRLLEERVRASPEQAARALEALRGAEERGYPLPWLVRRIEEGAARGAAPEAVLEVLQTRLERLQEADAALAAAVRRGLSPDGREKALMILAEALGGPLKKEDLEALAGPAAEAGRSAEDLARAAEVLAELSAKGVPVGHARAVVAAALEAGRSGREIREAGRLMLEAPALRLSQEEARNLLVEGLGRGDSLRRLSEGLRQAAGFSAEERGLERPIREELRERGFLREQIERRGP